MIKYRYKWISIYVVGLKSKLFLRKTGQSSAIKLYSNTLNILCVEKFILFFNLVAISPARGWKKFKKARNGWQSVEGRINGFTLARKSDFVMLDFTSGFFPKILQFLWRGHYRGLNVSFILLRSNFIYF